MSSTITRKGKARIDGIDYISKRDGEAGSLGRTGSRATRKPTLAELEAALGDDDEGPT